MSMKSGKEQWMDDIMGSLDGIQPIDANPYLFEKIKLKLSNPRDRYINKKYTWSLIGGLTMLLIMNCIALKVYLKPTKSESIAGIESLVNVYHLKPDNSMGLNE